MSDSRFLGSTAGSSAPQGSVTSLFAFDEHSLETMMHLIEGFVLVLSIISFFFFLYQYIFKKRCDWELIYIAFFEALADAGHLYYGSNLESAIYVKLANGVTINWLRYMLWLSTCPLITRHIFALSTISEDTRLTTNQLVVMLCTTQVMILAGVSAAFMGGSSPLLYWVCCLFSWGVGVQHYYEVYRCTEIGLAELKHEPALWKALKQIQVLFMVSWLIFPILFMLGPESFGVISMTASNVLHACGDIFAKNLFSVLAWRLHFVILPAIEENGSDVCSLDDAKSVSSKVTPRSSRKLSVVGSISKSLIVVDYNSVICAVFQSVASNLKFDMQSCVSVDSAAEALRTLKSSVKVVAVNYDVVKHLDMKTMIRTINAIGGSNVHLIFYRSGRNSDSEEMLIQSDNDASENVHTVDNVLEDGAIQNLLASIGNSATMMNAGLISGVANVGSPRSVSNTPTGSPLLGSKKVSKEEEPMSETALETLRRIKDDMASLIKEQEVMETIRRRKRGEQKGIMTKKPGHKKDAMAAWNNRTEKNETLKHTASFRSTASSSSGGLTRDPMAAWNNRTEKNETLKHTASFRSTGSALGFDATDDLHVDYNSDSSIVRTVV